MFNAKFVTEARAPERSKFRSYATQCPDMRGPYGSGGGLACGGSAAGSFDGGPVAAAPMEVVLRRWPHSGGRTEGASRVLLTACCHAAEPAHDKTFPVLRSRPQQECACTPSIHTHTQEAGLPYKGKEVGSSCRRWAKGITTVGVSSSDNSHITWQERFMDEKSLSSQGCLSQVCGGPWARVLLPEGSTT